jgi:hypothetical protein
LNAPKEHKMQVQELQKEEAQKALEMTKMDIMLAGSDTGMASAHGIMDSFIAIRTGDDTFVFVIYDAPLMVRLLTVKKLELTIRKVINELSTIL